MTNEDTRTELRLGVKKVSLQTNDDTFPAQQPERKGCAVPNNAGPGVPL